MGKTTLLLAVVLCGLSVALLPEVGVSPAAPATPGDANPASTEVLRCVAFGPYVGDLDPESGPHPSPALIDSLLDVVVNQAGFRCIMIYGVLNGLDYVLQAASERGIKVIAIIWLDTDESVNDASVERGIQLATAYPETIIRLSCGSEFRTRNGLAHDDIIRDCIQRVRAAGVSQPITSIDTWWEWCARSWPCQRSDLADSVDWIGVNVFPWWENKYSGLFPCTPAADAAEFHIARLHDVSATYSDKPVLLTEFGWPAGPDGYTETNLRTGQQCGVASEDNQRVVLEGTLARLNQLSLPGVLFEAFREGEWKSVKEGPAGRFWGICDGVPPYACHLQYGPPGPPLDLTPLPSGWTNTNTLALEWTNPSHPTGVLAAWYKLSSAPASSTDGTRVSGDDIHTIADLQVTEEGEHQVFIWLEDRTGNADHNNRSSAVLSYDATPPGGGTIAVSGGAATTSSLLVMVNSLGAADTMSGLAQMRFSNDNATWSAWEDHASTRSSWDLSQYGGNAEPGAKTVSVQYRDGAGNESPSFSDTITYVPPDTIPPRIVHTPLTSGAPSSAINIVATITDNVGVHAASLSYRPRGATRYSTQALAASGSAYSGVIPASAVTAVGVEYYLEAADSSGNKTSSPITAPTAPYAVAVLFTDPSVIPQGTLVKAIHFTELRQAINTLRSRYGLGDFPWTDPTLSGRSTPVKAVHLGELRTALDQAYRAPGCTRPACAAPPTYTDPALAARQTLIKAVHIDELRAGVRALD